VSFSIGDLRRAHRVGDRLTFWGVPALLMTWSGAFGLCSLALALWTHEYFMLRLRGARADLFDRLLHALGSRLYEAGVTASSSCF
jgi:hypothetical protein